MAFASVLGHERIKDLLARALSGRRLPHALLLAGPDGVGKRTLALALVGAMLCEQGGAEACGLCSTCARVARALAKLDEYRSAAQKADEPTLFNFRLHPDLVLVEPASGGRRPEIRVDQMRDLVRDVAGPPFEARSRVFILDDAHLLREEAANALLKSLEEPPPEAHLVLVSSVPQALLPTIRSRCQMLRFSALPIGLVEARLREEGLASEEAHLRATLAAGSLGSALAFESDAYRAQREGIIALLESSAQGLGPLGRMEAAERLKDAENPALALIALRALLRDLAALRAGAEGGRLLNADVAARLAPLARGPLGARAAELADAANEARDALRGYANELLTLDLLVEKVAG
jgi:DNA polymerase-3 subunit delta'